jgi:predicted transcriptional regulator
VLPAQAIERLRAAGGKANGSIRGVGKLLGTRSKSAAHRVLHQLADAGLITMAAGRHGVRVALA